MKEEKLGKMAQKIYEEIEKSVRKFRKRTKKKAKKIIFIIDEFLKEEITSLATKYSTKIYLALEEDTFCPVYFNPIIYALSCGRDEELEEDLKLFCEKFYQLRIKYFIINFIPSEFEKIYEPIIGVV